MKKNEERMRQLTSVLLTAALGAGCLWCSHTYPNTPLYFLKAFGYMFLLATALTILTLTIDIIGNRKGPLMVAIAFAVVLLRSWLFPDNEVLEYIALFVGAFLIGRASRLFETMNEKKSEASQEEKME